MHDWLKVQQQMKGASVWLEAGIQHGGKYERMNWTCLLSACYWNNKQVLFAMAFEGDGEYFS